MRKAKGTKDSHRRWSRPVVMVGLAIFALWRMTDGMLLRTPSAGPGAREVVLGPLPAQVDTVIKTQSLSLGFDALAGFPTDGSAWLSMARRLRSEGHNEAAALARQWAVTLAPAQASVLRRAARDHLREGQYEQAVKLWQRAWQGPAANARGVLRDLTNSMARPEALAPMLASVDDPSLAAAWTSEAARHPQHLQTARSMLAVFERRGWDMQQARGDIVSALARHGRWDDAYLAWLKGLSQAELRQLPWVYDGGFEQPFSGTPFEWAFPSEVGVNWQRTPGPEGRGMVLHVVFSGVRVKLTGAGQTLRLTPGTYRLEYTHKSAAIETSGALGWTLRCTGKGYRLLATSPPLANGDMDWVTSTVEFSVPAEPACQAQRLALGLAGELAADSRIAGSAWFDDIRVNRIDSPLAIADNP